MGFGSGSGDDPFEDEDDTDEPVGETASRQQQGQAATLEEKSPVNAEGTSREQTSQREPTSNGAQSATSPSQQTTEQPTGFSEVDVTESYSTVELAQMLMADGYHEENPEVPYVMWRNGTSTGRELTSLEMNPKVNILLRKAMREFEERYETEINKSDLREFALVYGLTHVDEVFEMAEEWSLQYNG